MPRDGAARTDGDEAVFGTPSLSDDIEARDLDREVRQELRGLSRPVADRVARHLVAAGRLMDVDPDSAFAHALAARRLAPRIAAVRESAGLAAYQAGEWQAAVGELRAYHRMAGRQSHLALIADCERALGRPERAVDLYRHADPAQLSPTEANELLIVAAGARADLGQRDAAVSMLQVPDLTAEPPTEWTARLRYAYADALLAVGRRAQAREWFARAAEADEQLGTDAAERLLELDGVVIEGDERDEIDDEIDGEIDGERETDREGGHGEVLADEDVDGEDLEDEDLADEDIDEDLEDEDLEDEDVADEDFADEDVDEDLEDEVADGDVDDDLDTEDWDDDEPTDGEQSNDGKRINDGEPAGNGPDRDARPGNDGDPNAPGRTDAGEAP